MRDPGRLLERNDFSLENYKSYMSLPKRRHMFEEGKKKVFRKNGTESFFRKKVQIVQHIVT